MTSEISFEDLQPGHIGCIKGICDEISSRNRVQVDFGHGNVFNMLETQVETASLSIGKIGDKAYSTIDHGRYFKIGDKCTLVGPSTEQERSDRDRVGVRFGIGVTIFNLTVEMLSIEPPVRSFFSPDHVLPTAAARELQSLMDAMNNLSLKEQARLAEGLAPVPNGELRTEDVSLISHAHGRYRRAERNILRRELQAAIKYGNKESANPGRDGALRWRYTYDGVVYITDSTSRHEITSWRIDGDDEDAIAPAEIELAGKGCHAVLIVDNSGSMRAGDVQGYKTRASAVYQCLIRDFVKEQVKTGAGKDVVVSLISMSDQATLLLDKRPLAESLVGELESFESRRPRSHGNYLPALDMALNAMVEDAPNRASLLLLFFSDGAPSDQTFMPCEHGVEVFQIDRITDPNMGHKTKGSAWSCRKQIHQNVREGCLDRVKRIGQIFGRDKVIFRTLAFGPPKENFEILEEMARALPRGEFQKLGLNVSNLKTAFSSLSSSMTELRTEGGGRLLTPRRDKVVDRQQTIDLSSEKIRSEDGWWIYSFEEFLGKHVFDKTLKKFLKCPLTGGTTGLAFVSQPFAEGAERFVYRCTEIEIPEECADAWYYHGVDHKTGFQTRALRTGLRLVAKEAKDIENHSRGFKFHETFARIQSDAAELAQHFVQSLPSHRADWNLTFLQTYIYTCYDEDYKDSTAWVLVEPELDGKFTKWNNNAGAVRGKTRATTSGQSGPSLGVGTMAFLEEEDEENSEDETEQIEVDDVPQAISPMSSRGGRC